jgi:hypothetical protein
MTTREKIFSMLKLARPHALRVVHLLFILSFLLPYIDVMGCSTKKISTYTGSQLILKQDSPASLYLAAMGVFAAFFIFSFFGKKASASLGAFAAAWRVIAAAVSGFIIGLLPGLQFLFDGVFMRAGQFLGFLCAGVVIIDGIIISAGGYIGLRKERAVAPGSTGPAGLLRYHAAVMIAGLAMVPAYAVILHNEIPLAVLYFFFLTLPFVLSQCIVMEGVRRGEAWTRRWAFAAAAVIAAGVVVTVLGFL